MLSVLGWGGEVGAGTPPKLGAVITLLKDMVLEVRDEIEKNTLLYEKSKCETDRIIKETGASIKDASDKIGELEVYYMRSIKLHLMYSHCRVGDPK